MDEIRIENLEVYAYHGVYEKEKEKYEADKLELEKEKLKLLLSL